MHMMKKCGGLPCDRHLDRRKVAIAAAAAILLFATSAQGGVVDLLMDSAVSSLTLSGAVQGEAGNPSIPGANFVFTKQTDQSGGGANGLLSFFQGHLYMAETIGTSIQPLVTGKGYQQAIGSATTPMGPERMGQFIPNDINGTPVTGPVPGYPNALPWDWGEYGVSVAAIGAFARYWDLDIGPSAYASGAMPFVGGTAYAVAPQIWGQLYGYEDFVSGLGGDHVVLASDFGGGPFPMPLSGTFDARTATLIANGGNPVYTPGAGVATWDGVTLTINVNGTLRYTIDDNDTPAGGDDINITQTFAGQLVYHPYVPEPSSVVLAGCGIVGLLSYAWRSRKRLPLVA